MAKTCFLCCSQCYLSIADANQKFCLTSCYHVFCAGCLNNKNFCNVCKKQCKILPINEKLPKEVKMFVEPNAYSQCIQTIVKVQEFQQSQIKVYAENNYYHRKKYYQVKKQLSAIVSYKKKLMESMKREKQIIEKLKEAYRTNVITPDLFQLCSQAGSPQGLKPTNDLESTMDSSMIASPASSVFRDKKNPLGSRAKEFPQSLNMSNFTGGSQVQNSQRPHSNRNFSNRNDVMKEARKGLIANTLRGMNQATQSKSQMKNSQHLGMKNFKI